MGDTYRGSPYEDRYWLQGYARIFDTDGLSLLTGKGITWDYPQGANMTNCSMDTMLDDVGPSGSFDFWEFMKFSGAIAALFLQPALANLIRAIFVMIDPLSSFAGRIVVPYKQKTGLDLEVVCTGKEVKFSAGSADEITIEAVELFKQECQDKELLKDIRLFERQKNVCPLIFWTVITILLAVSLIQ